MRIYRAGEVPRDKLSARRGTAANVEAVVSQIIDRVIREGDSALFDYTERFDRVRLDALEVTREEFDAAMAQVDPALLEVLREAAANIRAYHEKQVRHDIVMSEREGVLLGMKFTPIEKVGLYVPNGTAASTLPSLQGGVTITSSRQPAILAGMASISTVEG